MENAIAIALGGALGALSRYYLSSYVNNYFGKGFPFGTFAVNVLGSFLMGICLFYFSKEPVNEGLSDAWRQFFTVGILGSLTTFSTFSAESVLLFQQGEINKVMLNIFLNVAICMVAVFAGMHLSKQLIS